MHYLEIYNLWKSGENKIRNKGFIQPLGPKNPPRNSRNSHFLCFKTPWFEIKLSRGKIISEDDTSGVKQSIPKSVFCNK